MAVSPDPDVEQPTLLIPDGEDLPSETWIRRSEGARRCICAVAVGKRRSMAGLWVVGFAWNAFWPFPPWTFFGFMQRYPPTFTPARSHYPPPRRGGGPSQHPPAVGTDPTDPSRAP